MTPRPRRIGEEVNARELQIAFSSAVKNSFRSLADIARTSEHFDTEMFSMLEDWSSGKAISVHDVMIAFPLIAEQVATHIAATKDSAASTAWRELCEQMPEQGFKVSETPRRAR